MSKLPKDPNTIWRLSGEKAREAVEMFLRGAILLLIAHAAAIFGILTFLKERSALPEIRWPGMFLGAACFGFLFALLGYAMMFMERIKCLGSEPLTLAERPDFKKSVFALAVSFILLTVYVAAVAIMSANIK
jgi:hypothetical protein